MLPSSTMAQTLRPERGIEERPYVALHFFPGTYAPLNAYMP